jgi:catechol 2,3-dioxygenase-like lactoylglutathione lyase family enzyme
LPAIGFYCDRLAFTEVMHPAPTFAMLSRGDLRLVLSAPEAARVAVRRCPTERGRDRAAGNRFAIEVEDLPATVEELRVAGVRFRNEIIGGVGGRQIIAEYPSGNPVELFQPTDPNSKL